MIFEKNIGGVDFFVDIDDLFFRKYTDFFCKLFFHWNESQISACSDVLHITSRRVDCDNCIICNTKNKKWMFYFICDIEHYILKVVNKFVLHGAALVYKEMTICLCGKRCSGKTTTAINLIKHNKSKLITDECIIMTDNYFFGCGFPAISRDYIFGSTAIFDDGGKNRYLFCHDYIIDKGPNNPLFLFICLNDCDNHWYALSEKNFFNELLKNCKYSSNNKDKISTIINLVRNNKGYRINYTDFDNLLRMIDEIIGVFYEKK